MDFDSFPSYLKQYVLLFCNVKDLTRYRELSQSSNNDAQNTAKAIHSAIVFKYYDDFPQREQWLVSAPQFDLLRDILEERAYILRGFTLYSLNMRALTWKRCVDCARDRTRAALLFKGGFMYAIGSNSVAARGTCEKYNPLTNRWVTVAPYPADLELYRTVSCNENIYLFGRKKLADGSRTDEQIYKLSATETGEETWQRQDVQLPPSLYFFETVSFKGKIWIVGKIHAFTGMLDVYIYDTGTGTIDLGPSVSCTQPVVKVFDTDDCIYVLVGDSKQKKWMKCSDEKGQWKVHGPSYKDPKKLLVFYAVHNERVTCLNPAGQQCDACNLVTGQWDSELVASSSADVGVNVTQIMVPPEVHIDGQGSIIGYSPRRFTWG